ncbi:hybrid sensor histidine kinase/response regulator [Pseudomonas sp. Leaf58]|uniref:hybrid sensor histidine kinase/response regulator n=1 Tax=Pseudomonas sp. Leaf58 TaxID=1736226 RepID=UPI000B23A2B3|nr:ATP-binding protein [Pseudomonas sp. Leaf58]
MIVKNYRRFADKMPWRALANHLVKKTRFKGLITRSMMGTTLLLTLVVLVTQVYSLHDGVREEAYRTGERIAQALSEKLLVPITTGDDAETLRVLESGLKDTAVMRLSLKVDPVVPGDKASELSVDSEPSHKGLTLQVFSTLCSICAEPLLHKSYTFDVKSDDFQSSLESTGKQNRRLGSVLITMDLSDIVGPRLNQIAIIMLVVGILALFSLSLTAAIKHHMTDPLEKLLLLMRKLRAELNKPEGEERMRLKDGDFPQTHQRDMNDLVNSLKALVRSYYDKEDAMTEELNNRETTIALATESLTKLLKKANEANQIKDNFINLMSHELRQPLYASKTAALNIARDPVVNSMPSLKRNVDLIIREMAKGDQQINNVLDFSKNRRDPRAPVIGSFDLFRKVECAVSSASGQAYARELYIDFIVDGEVPNQVESCDNSWGHIIDNYISNAIKYTNEGGVRVILGQSELTNKDTTWIRFAVEDTGIGVPEEKLEFIFEPFSQVESALTRSHNGFGLGLAIVSEHVAALGGKRGVDRLPEGGMRFWVEIPLTRARAQSVDQSSGQARLKKLNAQFVILDPRDSFRKSIKSRLLNFDGSCHDAGSIEALEALLPSLTEQQRILVVRRVASREFREFAGFSLPELKEKGFDYVISLEPTLESDAVEGVYTRGEADFGFVESIEMITFIGQLAEKQNVGGREDRDRGHFLDLLRVTENETLRDVKVLLVDDHQTNLDVMSQSLEGYGAEVVTALGGEKAIALAREQAFDVILMDIMMPKIGGTEATRHIRSESMNVDTPIFALSAAALDPGTQQEMRHLKMEHLSKMTAGETLVFEIKNAMANRPPEPMMRLVKS